MAPVSIENLSFSYNGHQVLRQVSIQIQKGLITTILGPNGSGKTTLLKLILGLLTPNQGTISVAGQNLKDMPPREKARILAYVPQKHVPAFSYPVIEVVAMGRHPYSSVFARTGDKDIEIARASLERLKIDHLQDRPYTELSGGEQQLVLIARALTQQAEILILDEPVSGLDYGNQVMLLKQLKSLAYEGVTCINTSHFPEHALWTSDEAIFLRNGELIAGGKTDEIITSENLERVYQRKISVIEFKNGEKTGKTCIPDFTG